MMVRMRIVGLIVAGMGAAASTVAAGPLRAGAVSDDATWVVHVDVEALLASSLGQFVLEHAQQEIGIDGLEEMQRKLGIDPREDVFSVTAFGVGEDEDRIVALIDGSGALEGVLDRIEHEMDGEHRTIRRGGVTVHQFTGDDETWSMSMVDSGRRRTLVLSSDMDRLLGAIERLDRRGRAPVLAQRRPARGSFVFIAASEIPDGTHDHGPASVLLKDARGLTLNIGEAGGQLFVRGALETTGMEKAQMAVQALQGLKAMGLMMMASDPDMAAAAQLLQGVTVELENSTLVASFEIDSEAALGQLEAIIAEQQGDAGWGDEPDVRDESEEARIERLERRIEELEEELDERENRPQ